MFLLFRLNVEVSKVQTSFFFAWCSPFGKLMQVDIVWQVITDIPWCLVKNLLFLLPLQSCLNSLGRHYQLGRKLARQHFNLLQGIFDFSVHNYMYNMTQIWLCHMYIIHLEHTLTHLVPQCGTSNIDFEIHLRQGYLLLWFQAPILSWLLSFADSRMHKAVGSWKMLWQGWMQTAASDSSTFQLSWDQSRSRCLIIFCNVSFFFELYAFTKLNPWLPEAMSLDCRVASGRYDSIEHAPCTQFSIMLIGVCQALAALASSILNVAINPLALNLLQDLASTATILLVMDTPCLCRHVTGVHDIQGVHLHHLWPCPKYVLRNRCAAVQGLFSSAHNVFVTAQCHITPKSFENVVDRQTTLFLAKRNCSQRRTWALLAHGRRNANSLQWNGKLIGGAAVFGC